jgi:hypothetical protein
MKNYLPNICPLCKKIQSANYSSDKNRDYLQCNHCLLIYVAEECYLTPSEEKAQYDFHINSPDDQRYRQFLSRLFIPLCARLPKQGSGLDFGCGPGPTLSVMFEEAGFHMSIYDLFYVNNTSVFESNYQFISATEVFEHLKDPGQEINRLLSRIIPGGYLAVMTKLVEQPKQKNNDRFKNWHYKNDLTHICFYSQETFLWIAEKYQLKVEFIASDVIIMQKLQ